MEPPSCFNNKQLRLIEGWVLVLKHEKAKADVILMQISPLVKHLHLAYMDWYPPEFDEADLD
ncbi:hypothetical protein ARMGADRAFT_1092293 [Armillaria gallica]|uniref:Uncharacterized protein n=1 Tax=Armillaria gallica TaxID=47427 RepID=A0A2H3CB91_ARMGA|nr:hypothetical protein ARMGADRAFT_1092293 [Armillaria gallica]